MASSNRKAKELASVVFEDDFLLRLRDLHAIHSLDCPAGVSYSLVSGLFVFGMHYARKKVSLKRH